MDGKLSGNFKGPRRIARAYSNDALEARRGKGNVEYRPDILKLCVSSNYDSVTTGILQIRWTDDGDRDVAALATMYIAEVPNESFVS